MSLKDQLTGMKHRLKKTSTKEANLDSKEVQLCSSSEQYLSLMEETHMEKYFDMIKDHTFKSHMIPLSPDEAQALVAAREEWLEGGGRGGVVDSAKLVVNNTVLVGLAGRIDEVKQEQSWKYVFVRLSSLSPKDGALNSSRFEEVYEEELKNLETEVAVSESKSDLNLKLHALYRASTWCLAMEDGIRAVQIFIEADRTYNDLKAHAAKSKTYMEDKDTEEFNVVIREFRHFPVELEFRGFIYKKKFTALTQYNEFCFFPQITGELKDAIQLRIQESFQQLLETIPLDSYVVDFVLATTGEGADKEAQDRDKRMQLPLAEYKVWVIELNPMAEFAGTGLFSWLTDKPVLLGRKPFEFRSHAALPEAKHVLANMAPSWKLRLGL